MRVSAVPFTLTIGGNTITGVVNRRAFKSGKKGFHISAKIPAADLIADFHNERYFQVSIPLVVPKSESLDLENIGLEEQGESSQAEVQPEFSEEKQQVIKP